MTNFYKGNSERIRNRSVFLYSNQPVVRLMDHYFCKYKSFIDFLCCLAEIADEYRLVVPCKEVTDSTAISGMYPIHFRRRPIEVIGYDREIFAPLISLINAIKIRSIVVSAAENGNVIFCGPGPNSFLVYLSYILPKSVRYGFIIRGDTLKTVRSIYRGSWRLYASTALVRFFMRRISNLLNASRAIAFLIGAHLKENYTGPPQSLTEISPLVDERFVRNSVRPFIPEKTPLKFLYVGRFSPEKNVIELIRAFELAAIPERKWHLTIVGTGPLEAEVRTKGLKLNAQLSFAGHVADEDEMKALYDSHHILCLSSLTEGTPGSVIEAFARGMPVLATAVGSLPHHFAEEIKFIEGYSAEKIFEGMEWCDKHRKEMSEMGRKGRRKVSKFLLKHNALAVHARIRELSESGRAN
ncbi:MAG: glycosyltransferase family 4 protein [Deltaproteobacteria bacterium]|nr:glycosyltransferase family 4 protein [Deltaproteobacteria bacterium]